VTKTEIIVGSQKTLENGVTCITTDGGWLYLAGHKDFLIGVIPFDPCILAASMQTEGNNAHLFFQEGTPLTQRAIPPALSTASGEPMAISAFVPE